MKRYGYLYDRIADVDNLRLADKRAQKGKKNQIGVIKHNRNREQNILRLNKFLINKTYRTSKYSVFTIYEPKKRIISVLKYFPNRILQWALINIIGPIFIKCFISQTYSSLRGRGIHKCLNKLSEYFRDWNNTQYCLKLDIAKFYESINKNILKQKLRDKFKDRDLLNLLFEIIDSHNPGLPLGSLLSQWLGNFYLNDFDHYLKENLKVKYILRYLDDIVILHASKEYLHNLRVQIQIYLSENLHLNLSRWQIFPVASRGIDFLGYVNYHTYRLLRKSIKNRWKRMMRKYRNTKSINSYGGWLKHCNSVNLQSKY